MLCQSACYICAMLCQSACVACRQSRGRQMSCSLCHALSVCMLWLVMLCQSACVACRQSRDRQVSCSVRVHALSVSCSVRVHALRAVNPEIGMCHALSVPCSVRGHALSVSVHLTMTIYLMNSLQKITYIHRLCMFLAGPTYTGLVPPIYQFYFLRSSFFFSPLQPPERLRQISFAASSLSRTK